MFKSKKILVTTLTLLVVLSAVAICLEYGGRWYGKGWGTTTPPIPTPNEIVIYPFHEWKGDIVNNEFFGVWIDEKHNGYGQFRGKVEQTHIKDITRSKGKWSWMTPKGYLITMGTYEIYFNNKTWKCEGKWLNTHNKDHGGIEGIRLE